jgi:alcohol dehydrogenase (quinone), cytochrome c subunit
MFRVQYEPCAKIGILRGTERNEMQTVVLWLCVAGVIAVVLLAAKPQGVAPDRGAQVYKAYCVRCHGADGLGVHGTNVLRGTSIRVTNPDSLLTALVFGSSGTSSAQKGDVQSMPPVPYSDEDIAAVARYVLRTIGKNKSNISVQDVRNIRQKKLLQQRR